MSPPRSTRSTDRYPIQGAAACDDAAGAVGVAPSALCWPTLPVRSTRSPEIIRRGSGLQRPSSHTRVRRNLHALAAGRRCAQRTIRSNASRLLASLRLSSGTSTSPSHGFSCSGYIAAKTATPVRGHTRTNRRTRTRARARLFNVTEITAIMLGVATPLVLRQ
jgi:hypothetical protein